MIKKYTKLERAVITQLLLKELKKAGYTKVIIEHNSISGHPKEDRYWQEIYNKEKKGSKGYYECYHEWPRIWEVYKRMFERNRIDLTCFCFGSCGNFHKVCVTSEMKERLIFGVYELINKLWVRRDILPGEQFFPSSRQ